MQASEQAIRARAYARKMHLPRIRRLRDVQAFLHGVLADGSRLRADEVIAAALLAGIGRRTLSRAKVRLGVRTERVGFGPGGHFVWFLPRKCA